LSAAEKNYYGGMILESITDGVNGESGDSMLDAANDLIRWIKSPELLVSLNEANEVEMGAIRSDAMRTDYQQGAEDDDEEEEEEWESYESTDDRERGSKEEINDDQEYFDANEGSGDDGVAMLTDEDIAEHGDTSSNTQSNTLYNSAAGSTAGVDAIANTGLGVVLVGSTSNGWDSSPSVSADSSSNSNPSPSPSPNPSPNPSLSPGSSNNISDNINIDIAIDLNEDSGSNSSNSGASIGPPEPEPGHFLDGMPVTADRKKASASAWEFMADEKVGVRKFWHR
jgi:hypothetical protein